jgi:hypothetical protein
MAMATQTKINERLFGLSKFNFAYSTQDYTARAREFRCLNIYLSEGHC